MHLQAKSFLIHTVNTFGILAASETFRHFLRMINVTEPSYCQDSLCVFSLLQLLIEKG